MADRLEFEDPEIDLIAHIEHAFGAFDAKARARVLEWAISWHRQAIQREGLLDAGAQERLVDRELRSME